MTQNVVRVKPAYSHFTVMTGEYIEENSTRASGAQVLRGPVVPRRENTELLWSKVIVLTSKNGKMQDHVDAMVNKCTLEHIYGFCFVFLSICSYI